MHRVRGDHRCWAIASDFSHLRRLYRIAIRKTSICFTFLYNVSEFDFLGNQRTFHQSITVINQTQNSIYLLQRHADYIWSRCAFKTTVFTNWLSNVYWKTRRMQTDKNIRWLRGDRNRLMFMLDSITKLISFRSRVIYSYIPRHREVRMFEQRWWENISNA